MNWFQISRDVTSVAPEVITTIFGVPITNSFLLIVLIIALLSCIAFFVVRRFTIVPSKTQLWMESIYEYVVDLTDQIAGNKKLSRQIFPLIGSLFIYIAVANLIGLVPGISSFTYNGSQIFRTPTSDFNTTLGLALACVGIIQLASLRDYGFFGYIGRFIRVKELRDGFRKSFKDGILSVVDFLIGFLDIVSECAKVISLSFRLFGNMFAGEVLAVLILGALAYLLPALWLSMNLLFAVVQAIVFGSLVAAYWTLSVKPVEEGEIKEV